MTNPNIHQVVNVTMHGYLDKSHVGHITVEARGIPQPSGYLNLVNSRAVLALRSSHLRAIGYVTLVNARAIRGALVFPHKLGKFDFILTTNPTSYDRLVGTLTLIHSSSGRNPKDKDPAGLV